MRDFLISTYAKTYQYFPTAVRRIIRFFAVKFSLKEENRAAAIKTVAGIYSGLAVINKGDLVFDIGANTGIYSEAFLSFGAKVVAIEPQSNCVEIMRNKIGSRKDFYCECAGVGSKVGYLDLFVSASGTNWASTFSQKHKRLEEANYKTDYVESRRVPVTTLDALIRDHGTPRYIKIDVEGFEKEVLEGLTSPIELISFEFHSSSLEDAEVCAGILEKMGNRKFNLCNEKDGFVFPKWKSSTVVLDYIKKNSQIVAGDIFAAQPHEGRE